VRSVEPANVEQTPGLVNRIADFWTRNVNAERIMGREVTAQERGSEAYFVDLETQRYRSHRHLPGWIGSMQPGSHVLEVGCGIGLDSMRMARNGLRVTAVDLTVVGPATAQRRAMERGLDVTYSCADAEHLPFCDSTFDYVYSFGVMHHAPDTQKCIEEVYRVVKPGGVALIMLYHRRSLNEVVHRLLRVPFEERDELCPVVRRFSIDEVHAMFASFSQVDVHSDFVFGEGYGRLFRWTPQWLYRWLSRRIGWHLMIRATR
jgi:ubiquinone/menaquinone biosynthesis C-methylase UbiE